MTDADLQMFTERDLLIRIHTQMSALIDRVDDHEKRLRTVEQAQQQAKGFWQGANWIKTVLATVPVGALSYFIGRH